MAHPPAVVIIARHGMRLDAADQSWHLSTPTPYDPPLTYGGWNQCRALGVRIASILHAREQSFNNLSAESHENGVSKRRKRKKHKVVIHTSPFLRCLQTSVAISAGMAQYEAPKDRPTSSRTRTPATMHSASPRMRGMDSERLPHLAPIAEPKDDFAHEMARRALGEPKPRYRKSKLRIDAFLGEWLNPSYFDQITPPPPSPMMIASAKAALLNSDPVDIYTPTLSNKPSSGNSLWGGSGGRIASKESPLDDWSHVTDALAAPSPRRERSSSVSSVGSNESSGRKSPFRSAHGHGLHPFTSTVHKPEPAIYHPPTPSYAISNSDNIPRGYVAHARQATVNVDYAWDSSRPPLDWGDGGQLGEEWSEMHRRFRKGLNDLIQWYSQHNADDRGEDSLGFEQADRHHHEDEEEEDLVVIMVTHGAGSNALIGALTSQPVLLDVGMASLTMAVRKDDAPSLLSLPDSAPATPSPNGTPTQSPDPIAMMNGRRRSSLDIGLSAIYDMKLVSSSEHLRPGADPTKAPSSLLSANLRNAQEALSRNKPLASTAHAAAGSGIESTWNLGEPKRSNVSTAIGSIRRPSAPPNVPQRPSSAQNGRVNPRPPPPERVMTPPTFTAGLWTPPSGSGRGTPTLAAQNMADEKSSLFSKLDSNDGRHSPSTVTFNDSPPDSRPGSSNGTKSADSPHLDGTSEPKPAPKQQDSVISSTSEADEEGAEPDDMLGDLPSVSEKLPSSLSRGLSQKGLWGARPSGDRVARKFAKEMPKRRWTTHEND